MGTRLRQCGTSWNVREGANSADEVIRMYAPLLAEELWSHKWIRVAHIFGKVADLMRPDDRIKVLSYVIEHFRLLVGNTAVETAKFDFLSDNEPLCDTSLELFHFIVWFIDHPQRIRRDRAAAMIAWLVKGSTKYLEAAANYAFSNINGYRPDVLCGLLDYLSNAQPQILWETIRPPGVLQNVLRDCKHTGRLGVLQRIAERAGDAGIASGLEAAASVTEVFREGAIELQDSRVNCDLPLWANDLTPEWKMLAEIGMATDEIKVEFGKFMTESCKPLSIEDARDLEKALSLGFREPAEVLFNRWNGKLHSALNRALLAYGSKRNFKMIESILRIFNPTIPELTLTPNFESPCEAALLAIESHNDYAKAIGDDESLFLNYHEALAVGTNPNLTYIEGTGGNRANIQGKQKFIFTCHSLFFYLYVST